MRPEIAASRRTLWTVQNRYFNLLRQLALGARAQADADAARWLDTFTTLGSVLRMAGPARPPRTSRSRRGFRGGRRGRGGGLLSPAALSAVARMRPPRRLDPRLPGRRIGQQGPELGHPVEGDGDPPADLAPVALVLDAYVQIGRQLP